MYVAKSSVTSFFFTNTRTADNVQIESKRHAWSSEFAMTSCRDLAVSMAITSTNLISPTRFPCGTCLAN